MKISIEFKEKKYKVTYGLFSGMGVSVNEALDDLVKKFREEVGRFFTTQ